MLQEEVLDVQNCKKTNKQMIKTFFVTLFALLKGISRQLPSFFFACILEKHMQKKQTNKKNNLYTNTASHCFPSVDYWFITSNKAQGSSCICVCYINRFHIPLRCVSGEVPCMENLAGLIVQLHGQKYEWERLFWNSLNAVLLANYAFQFILSNMFICINGRTSGKNWLIG